MNASSKLRFPAMAGIILAAMLIIAVALDFFMSATGNQPVLGIETIGADLVRARASLLWSVDAWLYLLMVVPASIFAVGVFRALSSQDDGDLPAIGTTAWIIFWIGHAIHNAAIVAVLQTLAPRYVAGTAGGAGIEAAGRALLAFANTVFVPGGGVSTLLLIIGMTSFGQATMRSHQLPRWTGFAALACAAFSLLGYLQYLASPLIFLGLLGLIIYVLWQAGVSISLLRVRTATKPDHAAAPASNLAGGS